jgi:H+-translocating NAD(P) transhydrogenase subunit alpha
MSQSTADAPTAAVTVGVLKETAPGEQRVAVVPESVPALARARAQVLVESGAGAAAWFPDQAYQQAGARVLSRDETAARADVLVSVGAPPELIARLRAGQAVIGLLRPLVRPELARQLAEAGVTAISLDGLPRTVSRAQSMDALTSQANVAGYKAVLVAADTFGRFFPMLITAAGTSRPANVLVLGAGVAGLQAMGTARRLGAMVTGYDIRPETRDQIQSVGARFLQLGSQASAAGDGGYARALTAEEQAAQQVELAEQIARFDIVITTAQVPGQRPPLLVTAEAVKGMQAGSVLVDLAASSLGGNVEGSVADQTVLTGDGVRIIGAGNLPAQMPTAASVAYSHNVVALLAELAGEGGLAIDLTDEIQAGVVITHQGKVVHPGVAALLEPSPQGGTR